MALSYAPITTHGFISKSSNVHNKSLNKEMFTSPLLFKPLIIQTRLSSKHTGSSSLFVTSNDSNGESTEPGGEEYHQALETVLKLHDAVKNKNVSELSDVIGDECRCVCNFFYFFQHFQGKKQVLDFFTHLIKSLGNSFEFVVQPTESNGMTVGIHWKLEWNKTHVPLGKGFSFYTCHIYQGKVLIRNVEIFMEPLLHIEPFRLKMIECLTTILDKTSSNWMHYKSKRGLYVLLTLFFTAFLLLFFQFTFH